MSKLQTDTVVRIEAEINGEVHVVNAYPGQILLEALEDAGLTPPFSCRAGACASCMCKLVEGEVEMLENHVLDQAELDEHWILGCQSVPKTPLVRVRYSNS
ncbi:MAG: 2Fe-2S iron-sulfur cluster binding domain-containing protein [Nevskia sp.]|nr:2Fe-2S iron-sulfur cluster binding domain-containing protein [Nevskia sp.]